MVTRKEKVVVADGMGEEVAGILWIGELDYGLRAAQIGTSLAAQQLAFCNEMSGEVARNLEDGDWTFRHIAANAYADA